MYLHFISSYKINNGLWMLITHGANGNVGYNKQTSYSPVYLIKTY
jgi:hypothetical protein